MITVRNKKRLIFISSQAYIRGIIRLESMYSMIIAVTERGEGTTEDV